MGLMDNLKKAVEVCRPNLRHYYRIVKKARIVNTYASNGKYYCDVQPLRNDENIDENEPVIPKVALPVFGAEITGESSVRRVLAFFATFPIMTATRTILLFPISAGTAKTPLRRLGLMNSLSSLKAAYR